MLLNSGSASSKLWTPSSNTFENLGAFRMQFVYYVQLIYTNFRNSQRARHSRKGKCDVPQAAGSTFQTFVLYAFRYIHDHQDDACTLKASELLLFSCNKFIVNQECATLLLK